MRRIIILYVSITISGCIPPESPYLIEDKVDEAYSEMLLEQNDGQRAIAPDTNLPDANTDFISSTNAHLYIGEIQTIKISKAFCDYRPDIDGQPTLCNDRPYPNHSFTLLVWGQDWEYLDGTCLMIKGEVSTFEGDTQIVADSNTLVEICDSAFSGSQFSSSSLSGEEIFAGLCSACHGPGAQGIEGLGKSLIESNLVKSLSNDELVAFIANGRPATHSDNTTGVDMPPRGGNPALTDDDLLAVVLYLRGLIGE